MRLPAFLFLLLAAAASSAAELKSPAQAALDTQVPVAVVGEVDARAFVSIVPADTAEGSYEDYVYVGQREIAVPAPASAGNYEVRLYDAAPPYATLARRPILITSHTATLKAPGQAPIGTEIEIAWTGPSQSKEYITLVSKATPDGRYEKYEYTRGEGSGTVKLTTPIAPGAYELRYMTGRKHVVIARSALEVGGMAATVTAPATVVMGAPFEITWTGPANDRNYVTVVEPGKADARYDDYVYTKTDTVRLTAPEIAGAYEVRLVSADNSRVLARTALTVGAASATLEAPDSVEAGLYFDASWTGPGNELDYIAITKVGEPKKYVGYAYTKRGTPLALKAPATSGDYEIQYLTGRTEQSLARRPLRVTPAATPGTLRVVGADGATAGDSRSGNADAAANGASGKGAATIELILDASGSMLQRLGGERRIDIARRALDQLVQKQLPEGSPVALRVFGHRRAGACDTELLAPLAPLDRAALGATLRAVEAKNLAKTPIAASLAAVAGDLAGTEGQALIILVTDGEETCDGDPAAEIAKLRSGGFDVSLNIVGFAIDEFALEQEFRRWAELGGGAYFAATDAAGLNRSIAQAAQPVYSVLSNGKPVASGVVGGESLKLKPGKYQVTSGGRSWDVAVTAGETTVLPLK